MNAYSLARALTGNLTYSHEENSLDRLIALSLGSIGPGRESHLNSLGTSLIAFKHARAPAYYLHSVKDLGAALAWRKVKNRGAVARQAISEWVVDVCESCCGTTDDKGRGVIFDMNGVMRPCLSCGQTTKRKYEDHERKGIPGKAMSEAHSLISLAVSIAVRGAIRRLK